MAVWRVLRSLATVELWLAVVLFGAFLVGILFGVW